MRSMSQLGNDLYSGKTSFPFVQRRRLWFIIAAVLVIGAALVPLFRPVQFSIEFTGGAERHHLFVLTAENHRWSALHHRENIAGPANGTIRSWHYAPGPRAHAH